MAQSLQVPKFGKWDDGEDVPYTTYFDNATKAKSERLNLNDPSHREEISERQETREGVVRRQTESPLHRDGSELPGQDHDSLKSTTSRGQQALRQKYTQEDLSLEDGNTKKRLQSPLDHRTRGHVSFNSPLHQRQRNNTATVRNGAASDGNIENPSLQTRQHPRTEAKSVVPSSPLRDRRGSSSPKGGCHDGVTPLTPGRSRQQSAPRGIETPDRSPTVPRFGDWDESDPTSSENYTSIFTRVREERQTEEEGGFPVGTNISHADRRNRSDAENSKVHKSKNVAVFHGESDCGEVFVLPVRNENDEKLSSNGNLHASRNVAVFHGESDCGEVFVLPVRNENDEKLSSNGNLHASRNVAVFHGESDCGEVFVLPVRNENDEKLSSNGNLHASRYESITILEELEF